MAIGSETICSRVRGVVAEGGAGGYGPSSFFDVVGFSEILVLSRKVLGLLLLVKTKASNFIGKSLNLAPLLYRSHDNPVKS